jgi:hydroxylamine reductase
LHAKENVFVAVERRLGPRLPAFLTPDAVDLLVKNFKLKPADVKNPEEDVKQMLQHA